MACTAGEYKSYDGNVACKPCLHGATTLQVASESPYECVCGAGFEYHAESFACVRCPEGTFKNITDNSQCITCPENSVAASGASECTQCPEFSIVPQSNKSECVCMPGFKQVDEQCVPCPPGQFKNSADNSECTLCALGTFSQTPESHDCQKCSDTKSTVSKGATAETDCVCKEGYEFVQNTCMPCQVGFFKNSVGNSICLQCSGLQYSDSEGHFSCKTCPENSVPNDQHTGCECNENYIHSVDSEFCTQCPEFSSRLLSQEECICHAGYFKIVKDTAFGHQMACALCAPNHYCINNEQIQCPVHTTSLRGSFTPDNCTCVSGYELSE